MNNYKDIKKDIEIAAKYIKEGKLVAFPTETVYGLGANALDPIAVAKIFELKERPTFDPLIVHISSIDDLKILTTDTDDRVLKLAKKFWPGPLTIVLPKSNIVPDIVTSGLSTVGIRMPNNEIALELIKQSGCPIAAPSANKFGKISPTTAQHVKKQLPDVDFILDGGKTKVGIESTIISLNENGFEILRHGVITHKDIEEVIPYIPYSSQENLNQNLQDNTQNNTQDNMNTNFKKNTEKNTQELIAPGMLKSHYSPNKPLYILEESNQENICKKTDKNITKNIDKKSAGLISFTGKNTEGYKLVEILTSNCDLKEYAVNIFAAMHKLEESDVECIFVEAVPESGIGIAIMDRLRKAAYKYKL